MHMIVTLTWSPVRTKKSVKLMSTKPSQHGDWERHYPHSSPVNISPVYTYQTILREATKGGGKGGEWDYREQEALQMLVPLPPSSHASASRSAPTPPLFPTYGCSWANHCEWKRRYSPVNHLTLTSRYLSNLYYIVWLIHWNRQDTVLA